MLKRKIDSCYMVAYLKKKDIGEVIYDVDLEGLVN